MLSYKLREKYFMKKISIIIPTYNRAHLIERSVRSVLNQTYENIELIIVDDGSTDNTEQIIKSIDDNRIIYHKQENRGQSEARNTGALLSTSDYIAFHDSDDVWRENKLQRQMSYMEENPQYGMVYCSFLKHMLDGETFTTPNSNLIGETEGDMFLTLLVNNKISTQTMLLKKDLFLELGGFDLSLRCLEDWEFALRFSKSYYIGHVNETLVDVYQQPGSVSTNVIEYFETRCKMISNYKDILQKNNLLDYVVIKLFETAKLLNCQNTVMVLLAQLMYQD